MGGGSAEIFMVGQSLLKIVRAAQFFSAAQFFGKKCTRGKIGNLLFAATSLLRLTPKLVKRLPKKRLRYPPGTGGFRSLRVSCGVRRCIAEATKGRWGKGAEVGLMSKSEMARVVGGRGGPGS